eukprot:TRINITY_DN4378_c0_g1_i2.p2 TRINITY_DN4378_c0_g1~~TRINITY_DN4378_c0_g1_i2.p2  ORF type:complete len:348 (-),score=68.81 TRINITY_DN4378_c0_g1_i2:650-1693(-)
MYDTSPHSPLKGDVHQLWPEDIRIKELESLFDLDPALEESLDFGEFDTANPNLVGAPPPVVPDSAVVTTSVATGGGSVNLLTLTAAATTEHLLRLEGQGPAIFTAAGGSSNNNHHAVAAAAAPVVTTVEPSVFDQDLLMPEFNHGSVPVSTSIAATSLSQEGTWGGGQASSPFFTTVKTEDVTLSTLTACSLEASLPGFTSTSSAVCKSEPLGGHQDDSCSQFSVASPRSTRSLSESSTATSSTMPDSPRRSSLGKGGRSRRRQAPKDSCEYKEKRARNNVAVRKSRAKAKEKQKMTEGRVKELMDMNESLHKRLEMLTKEVNVLKGLFLNVGASLPDDFSKLMEVS